MNVRRTAEQGFHAALRRTADADAAVRAIMRPYQSHCEGLIILATGGYGRGDNSLRSDLDLIFLTDDDSDRYAESLRKLVQSLWDHGWTPGQTLFSLNELDKELLTVPDRASALLESRKVWGDPKVADKMDLKLNSTMSRKVWTRFVEEKHIEYVFRRRKFGESVRVIEPDLKAQAGGLRDLHHVFWIERARMARENGWRVQRRRYASIPPFLNRLANEKHLTQPEAEDLTNAYGVLLYVRENLREVAIRSDNQLTVELQPKVGLRLGISGDDQQVMRTLMRQVYWAMEKLARFSEEFGTVLSDVTGHGIPQRKPLIEIQSASEVSGLIYMEEDGPEKAASSPENLLGLVDACMEMEASLSGSVRHRLRREVNRNYSHEHNPKKWAGALADWFKLSDGVGRRLRRLSELDAIEPWLQEWREVNGLSTGSFYHTYTVDEHTLRALEELDRLPNKSLEGLAGTLWQGFAKKEWVYLAILLHDIAKGRPGDHGLLGAEVAEEAMQRLGWDHLAEPVAHLVRIHLKMEQTAFRRDPTDSTVLQDFAELVGDENMLVALYLLTVCDLRAVRNGVWTAWKGRLLAELYLATRQWMLIGRERVISVKDEAQILVPDSQENEAARRHAEEFLEDMRSEYRQVVPADEIANHLEARDEIRSGREKFRWLIDPEKDFIVLALVTKDRLRLVADVAGLLVSQGIGIREARLFTGKDGIVIDRFRAEDIEPDGIPLEERLRRIPEYWGKMERKETSIKRLMESYTRRSRRRRPPAAVVESEINLASAQKGWFIDVSASNSIGLLYRLCTAISEFGLDIHAARVTTRLDGIHDAFLVRDPAKKLEAEEGRDLLMRNLKKAVHE